MNAQDKIAIYILLIFSIVLIVIGACTAFGLAIGTMVLGVIALIAALLLIGLNG